MSSRDFHRQAASITPRKIVRRNAGKGVIHTYTIPSLIADQLPPEMTFVAEITHDGILLRPTEQVPQRKKKADQPQWLKDWAKRTPALVTDGPTAAAARKIIEERQAAALAARLVHPEAIPYDELKRRMQLRQQQTG